MSVPSTRFADRAQTPRLAAWTVSAIALSAGCAAKEPASAPVRVAAASDLAAAFSELGRDWERATGKRVAFTFGSTGLLARQIKERAPFDVFAAASSQFVEEVVRAGVCDPARRAPYGRGRVALYTKERGSLPDSLATLRDARFRRVAIANPEHAPYGKAAREALLHAGVWDELAPRIVYTENVRQAYQLARSGEVEAALVALALVIGEPEGTHLALEEQLHTPIEQELIACTAGANREGGHAFAAFVGSAHGREVMRRYGFLLPGEPGVSGK